MGNTVDSPPEDVHCRSPTTDHVRVFYVVYPWWERLRWCTTGSRAGSTIDPIPGTSPDLWRVQTDVTTSPRGLPPCATPRAHAREAGGGVVSTANDLTTTIDASLNAESSTSEQPLHVSIAPSGDHHRPQARTWAMPANRDNSPLCGASVVGVAGDED
jgi:hypothetical protein